VSEPKFEIYTPGVLNFDSWETMDKKHHCELGDKCLYLRGHLDGEAIAVEFGFNTDKGPYVAMWGPEPHNPNSYAGRWYLREIITLKKLAGDDDV